MAGQARRGTRGQGRSSHDDSSWPVLAAASAAVSGSVIATTTPEPTPETQRSLATRSTYRHLLLKGMAPEEAANLTAYMAGIPVGEARWTLKQINQLLFLRQMQQTGRFGGTDGNRTH
jgi:hypothetical protein